MMSSKFTYSTSSAGWTPNSGRVRRGFGGVDSGVPGETWAGVALWILRRGGWQSPPVAVGPESWRSNSRPRLVNNSAGPAATPITQHSTASTSTSNQYVP